MHVFPIRRMGKFQKIELSKSFARKTTEQRHALCVPLAKNRKIVPSIGPSYPMRAIFMGETRTYAQRIEIQTRDKEGQPDREGEREREGKCHSYTCDLYIRETAHTCPGYGCTHAYTRLSDHFDIPSTFRPLLFHLGPTATSDPYFSRFAVFFFAFAPSSSARREWGGKERERNRSSSHLKSRSTFPRLLFTHSCPEIFHPTGVDKHHRMDHPDEEFTSLGRPVAGR